VKTIIYNVEGANGKRWQMIMADWFVHGDSVTSEITGEEFVVWDPWYNRFLRFCFGGHNRILKLNNGK